MNTADTPTAPEKNPFRRKKSLAEKLRIGASRAVFLLLFLFAITTAPESFETVKGDVMEQFGFFLLIIGAIGRIWCSIYIAGRKDRILCTIGPYALCRNPLYFFSFFGALGFAFGLQSVLLVLIIAVLFLAYYHFVIRGEETRLRELFGADFEEYMKQVPRFFPRWRRHLPPDNYDSNPRVMERALTDNIWFLFAIILIEFLEVVHMSGNLILWRAPF